MCALAPAPGYEARAAELCKQLQLPIIEPSLATAAAFSCLLVVDEQGLGLQLTGPDAPGPVRCEFACGAAAHRRQYGGGRKQDISRAVGLDKRRDLHVLDMTAGLGRDAFVFATLGARVTLLERNPIVHALLADGLARAADTTDSELREIVARINLLRADSLAADAVTLPVDVAYLDPMFPGRQKSAKVKKEMQAFHTLVGADKDADQLLPIAREAARYRVVVKRPAKAPYLNGCKPGYSLNGKSTRYDIYSKQKLV
ncbi:MAG: class I SAM-dependent methyltransferase [Porticoccaceae bacterium]|nr:class I SAM-dependent methyltransferase [Porticoccaceae bacterium]